MREIKFRAWDRGLEKMFYSDDCFFSFIGGRLIERDGENGSNDLSQVVMQYTGLKDENGQNIYEGDIVEFMFFYYNGSEVEALKKGVIVLLEFGFYFKVSEDEIYYFGDLYFDPESQIKVIGTIYENNDLLKEIKQ
jgi:uncharacterized phage protein (TIGR01671 family)